MEIITVSLNIYMRLVCGIISIPIRKQKLLYWIWKSLRNMKEKTELLVLQQEIQ